MNVVAVDSALFDGGLALADKALRLLPDRGPVDARTRSEVRQLLILALGKLDASKTQSSLPLGD